MGRSDNRRGFTIYYFQSLLVWSTNSATKNVAVGRGLGGALVLRLHSCSKCGSFSESMRMCGGLYTSPHLYSGLLGDGIPEYRSATHCAQPSGANTNCCAGLGMAFVNMATLT